MLINYLKIAIAVFRRRKFFSFISLFGICFTLAMILVLAAVLDTVLLKNYPDAKRSRCLYIKGIYEKGATSFNGGSLSRYFIDHYLYSLKQPEKIAVVSMQSATYSYFNDRKVSFESRSVNAAYWDIMDFTFLEGKCFTATQERLGERVAVIGESLRKDYFGNTTAVGKYIEMNRQRYRVVGVVKQAPGFGYYFSGNFFIPLSLDYVTQSTSFYGNYYAILMATSATAVTAMQNEFDAMAKRIPPSNRPYASVVVCKAQSYSDSLIETVNDIDGFWLLWGSVGIFVLLIMALPAINMVNINITRIMERSSEIGVRKAFGASRVTLAGQFLVENLLLTLLGGLAGIVVAWLVLLYINQTNVFEYTALTIDFTVLLTAFFTCLVFGFISGVYPAWRMSRMQVAKALKG
ncbi:putative ABC transport system permease protein [Filimonas lacunae]|uniref:Putative ABC transport system permease protein n=1 Tax=Filimonas lacunae TaxID=477680 RepID=A0A173MMQ5_9BACT|nr:ABC transporter permease [Filimonas lacunae]BAV08933.1 ABC transporter, permease protein [Filimonas lacunae]SIS64237.1 putative ABC transport system permease protein [Filimonas lacunae]